MSILHWHDEVGSSAATSGALGIDDVPAALAMLEKLRDDDPDPALSARPRSPAPELTATTPAARILFTRDDLDTTYVSGRRGTMVLALDGAAYSVGRYDVAAGEWRVLSRGWPRFGNALAFACSVVS